MWDYRKSFKLYFDPRLQACIPFEFLVNPNIWHVKVSLVVYATVKMHESDRVIRKKPIKIGLHSTRNISTFGTIGTTLYLIVNPISFENQPTIQSKCHVLRNPRFRAIAEAGTSSTPTQEEEPMVAPPPDQYYFWTTTSVPTILHADSIAVLDDDDFDDHIYVDYVCGIDKNSVFFVINVWDTIHLYAYADSVTNTPGIIVLPRSTTQSTMDEGEDDERLEPQHVPEGGGDKEEEQPSL
ncbi:hypothetical protein Gotur_025051 [Gossypium turneri]